MRKNATGLRLQCVAGFILLLTSTTRVDLLAQTAPFRFKHLTVDDGLSQNLVYTILQDRKGFMWFGTKDGLNRYDGYRFTVFRHDPFDSASISGHEVRVLFEDRLGILWIGSAGLNRFDSRTETFTHYRHDPADHGTLSHNDVLSIAEDHDGALWIGTPRGLNRLAPDRAGPFIHFLHDPHDQQSISSDKITALLVDRTGTLWVGTTMGLNALPIGSNARFIRHQLNNTVITSLCEDSQGNLWVGTPTGLIRLNRDTATGETLAHYPHTSEEPSFDWQKTTTAIRGQSDDKLWVGTLTGLVLFDPRTGSSQHIRNDPANPSSISFNAVLSFYQDRGGVMWFGTAGKGLNKLDPYTKPFQYYGGAGQRSHAQSDFSVRAIFEDHIGLLWVVANDRVHQLDRATNQWRLFREVSQPVGSIAEDRDGVLHLDTGIGIFKVENRGKPTARIRLERKSKDALWAIGSDGAFHRMDRVVEWLTRAGIPNAAQVSIHRAYQDASGVIWLGSDAGLIRINVADSSVRSYRNDSRDQSSLSYDVVYSILSDPREPNRILWVGTAGGGLNRLDIDAGKFTRYTDNDGLPNNVVYGILPDRHGRLWMSTNRGLSVFDPDAKTFRNFDVRDGLQSNEFNRGAYFVSKSGEMFFGGINGLNAFYPDSIRDNPNPPQIVITGFQLANRSVTMHDSYSPLRQSIMVTEEIRLSYDQNTIAFEFVALDFAQPGKNRYAYMLENFDQQWIYTGSIRRASYTNLPPGEYVFRVKGSNSDNVWNNTGASIRLTITPPFWKTWWAYVLYCFLAAGSVVGIVKGRVRRLERRTQELEAAVQERTAKVVAHEKQLAVQAEKLQELDHIKSSFFANISHEFRTPLTLILGPVKRMIAEAAGADSKRELQRIEKNAQRLLRLVNQLLDLSKLETGMMTVQVSEGNILPLLKGITMSFASLAEQKHIKLQFCSDEDEVILYFDRDKIEKIFYNLLANAFKFTPDGGKVVVTVQRMAPSLPLSPSHAHLVDHVTITVKDSGIGIPANQLPHIFDRFYQIDRSSTREHEGTGIGLSLVKELVALHHGSVDVTSVEGQGSAFAVRLPMGSEAFSEDEIVEQVAQLATTLERPADELVTNVDVFVTESPAVQVRETPEYAELETIVLVVEDHEDVRAYIREYLETHYKVIEARDGAEGVDMAREAIPDLIVGDVMMPKMDGYEMCSALKEDERTSHIPVVLLTARAALEDKLVGLKTGADDYLTKPFDAMELLARVENLIESRRKLRERWTQTVVLRPRDIVATSIDQAFLEKALVVVEEHLGEENFSIEEFAQQMAMSRSQLHRKLHALTNQSASLFLRSVRLQRAAELLRQHAGNVAEIAYQTGFSSQAYFTRCFQARFGCSPKEYAQKS